MVEEVVLGVSHIGLYFKQQVFPKICELGSETSKMFTPCSRVKKNSLTCSVYTRRVGSEIPRWLNSAMRKAYEL